MTRKLFISFLFTLCLAPAHAQSVVAVPTLDPAKFSGAWYEVARYPYKREKNCVGDIILLVAEADKAHQLSLVSSCTAAKGFTDSWTRTAKPANKHNPTTGEFKITSTWPLSTKYWVLAVDPAYNWALIGSPNRKTLWVYAKSPQLDPATLAAIDARATAQGFPLDRFTPTPHK